MGILTLSQHERSDITDKSQIRTIPIRTDLAEEGIPADDPIREEVGNRQSEGFAEVNRLHIKDKRDSVRLGLPIGHYTTVSFRQDDLFTEEIPEKLAERIAREIHRMTGQHPIRSALAVGLGNRDVTPDSLGPLSVDRLPITRQIPDYPIKISGLSPGVIGQTGIDCGELIESWVRVDRPDLLLVIDALAAKSTDRLACTVQITDCGIVPGSGVGCHRSEISRSTMKIPVIAIGVPTVVDSRTLVLDALESAEMEANRRLIELLRDRQFYATLTDCDRRVRGLADLIADSLTRFFSLCSDS
ncbi:MAG: GPR endopeptidase [Eubacteriales bacterium]